MILTTESVLKAWRRKLRNFLKPACGVLASEDSLPGRGHGSLHDPHHDEKYVVDEAAATGINEAVAIAAREAVAIGAREAVVVRQ